MDPLVVYRPPATTTPLALFGSLLDNLSPIRVEDVLDLEYVRVTVDISHPYPNNLNIQLISPAGTRSRLADRHGIYELISLVITESSSTPIKVRSFTDVSTPEFFLDVSQLIIVFFSWPLILIIILTDKY